MQSKGLAALALGAALTVGVVGCSGVSYDERRAYLEATAQRGVEAHERMAAQGGSIDKKRCENAYYALSVEDLPDGGWNHSEWQREVKQTFVDSCTSGAAATPAPSASTSPTA